MIFYKTESVNAAEDHVENITMSEINSSTLAWSPRSLTAFCATTFDSANFATSERQRQTLMWPATVGLPDSNDGWLSSLRTKRKQRTMAIDDLVKNQVRVERTAGIVHKGAPVRTR